MFYEKINFEKITVKEKEVQRVYKYRIYPRYSKIHSAKGFVNIDIGSQSGTH